MRHLGPRFCGAWRNPRVPSVIPGTLGAVEAARGLGGGFVHRLAPSDRDELTAAGRVRRYPRGAAVFLEGDASDFVVLILEGRTKIVASTAEGTEALLSIRGSGDIVGELAAIDASAARRTASVIALEPLVCRVVQREEFLAFLERHPAAAIELLRMIASRLRHADRRRVEFGAYDTARRVARVLVDLIGEPDGAPTGTVYAGSGLSQQELAGLVGASRESVARALNVLRQQGVLATARRSVTVLDFERLRVYAG